MADEIALVEERVVAWRQRHPVLRFVAIGLLSLLLLLSAAIWMLDSGPGHRLIVDRIGALRPSSGLRIRIGRIDGSIWNRAKLRDLRLYDSQGLFLETPELDLDWRPAAWIANKLWIRRAETELLILHRLPKLKPSAKKGPLLPGFDIHLGRLKIERLRLEPPVAGKRRNCCAIRSPGSPLTSFPALTALPVPCARACFRIRSTRLRCRSTSGTPPASRGTSAGRSCSATSTAPGLAAAAPPPIATCTTFNTKRTAARPQ